MKMVIEYEPDSVVNVLCDREGVDFLVELLRKLRAGGHDHLMTEDWGGWELESDTLSPKAVPVHQLNIFVGTPGSAVLREPRER